MKVYQVILISAAVTISLFIVAFFTVDYILGKKYDEKVAGSKCAPHQAAMQFLAKEYGQVDGFIGVINEKQVFEVLVNPQTGSWTALQTSLKNGKSISCITANGFDYRTNFPREETKN